MSKLLLLDISGIVHRSFHSLNVNQFTTSTNIPTNAIYGLVKTLLSLHKEFNDYIFVACLDTHRHTLWRSNLNPDYKCNRPKTHPDLVRQFQYVNECLKAANIHCMSSIGYEADDVIASICYQNKSKDIVIVSSDKDMFQLLRFPNIKLYNPNTKQYLQNIDCINKYNVTPEQFTFYQTLVGDACDNIKGIKGIGPKKAATLVNQYKSLDVFLASNTKYDKYRDSILLDFKLVSLSLDIDFTYKNFSEQSFSSETFISFCETMEFKSILKQLTKL